MEYARTVDAAARPGPYAAPVPDDTGSRDPFAAVAGLEGVPSAVRAARDAVDAVLRDRGHRAIGPHVTSESLLRGAIASARIEGSGSDDATVRDGAGDPIARAAVRLSTELLGVLPAWQSAPLQALARLHAIAAAGVVDESELGRPVVSDGATRLATLARSLSAPTEAPGMVVAAIVHAEVVAAGAFASHNGLVARAAERLTLVGSGVDPASVTVPEAGHLATGDAYRLGLERYRTGGQVGLHGWVTQAVRAYAAGAEAAADLVR
jgi:hypothetical protein